MRWSNPGETSWKSSTRGWLPRCSVSHMLTQSGLKEVETDWYDAILKPRVGPDYLKSVSILTLHYKYLIQRCSLNLHHYLEVCSYLCYLLIFLANSQASTRTCFQFMNTHTQDLLGHAASLCLEPGGGNLSTLSCWMAQVRLFLQSLGFLTVVQCLMLCAWLHISDSTYTSILHFAHLLTWRFHLCKCTLGWNTSVDWVLTGCV